MTLPGSFRKRAFDAVTKLLIGIPAKAVLTGPIVVAQLFLVAGQNLQVLFWIGMVVVVLGLLFVLPTSSEQGTRTAWEIAR